MDLSIAQQLEQLERSGAASHRRLLSLLYIGISAVFVIASLYSSNLGLFISGMLILWIWHNELQINSHLQNACTSLHEVASVECDVEISEYFDEISGHHFCGCVTGQNRECLCKFEFSPEGWVPEIGHEKVHAYFTSTSKCPSLMIASKGLIIPN